MATNKKWVVIDGIRYHNDRPDNCSDCFFWKNYKRGCILREDNCYYLANGMNENSKCDNCPYASGRTCVSAACYKDLVSEMRAAR